MKKFIALFSAFMLFPAFAEEIAIDSQEGGHVCMMHFNSGCNFEGGGECQTKYGEYLGRGLVCLGSFGKAGCPKHNARGKCCPKPCTTSIKVKKKGKHSKVKIKSKYCDTYKGCLERDFGDTVSVWVAKKIDPNYLYEVMEEKPVHKKHSSKRKSGAKGKVESKKKKAKASVAAVVAPAPAPEVVVAPAPVVAPTPEAPVAAAASSAAVAAAAAVAASGPVAPAPVAAPAAPVATPVPVAPVDPAKK